MEKVSKGQRTKNRSTVKKVASGSRGSSSTVGKYKPQALKVGELFSLFLADTKASASK